MSMFQLIFMFLCQNPEPQMVTSETCNFLAIVQKMLFSIPILPVAALTIY